MWSLFLVNPKQNGLEAIAKPPGEIPVLEFRILPGNQLQVQVRQQRSCSRNSWIKLSSYTSGSHWRLEQPQQKTWPEFFLRYVFRPINPFDYHRIHRALRVINAVQSKTWFIKTLSHEKFCRFIKVKNTSDWSETANEYLIQIAVLLKHGRKER